MAEDTKDLKLQLSVVLDKFQSGLLKGEKAVSKFADHVGKAMAKSNVATSLFGKGGASAVGGFVSGAVKALTGFLSIGISIFGKLLSVVTSIFGKILSAVMSVLTTIGAALLALPGKVLGALGAVTKMLGVLGAAVGGAYAGLFALVNSAASAGDAIAKLSKRTGLSVKMLSEFQHIASLEDASLDDMQMAVKGLGVAVEGATRGLKENIDSFKRLGVEYEDSNGKLRNVEEVFWDVMFALQKVENPMLRAGLAQKLLGRSAQNLLPILSLTRKELEAERREAHAFGVVIGDEVAAKSERFKDALTRISQAWRGLRFALGAPLFDFFSEGMERSAQSIAKFSPRLREFTERALVPWLERTRIKVSAFAEKHIIPAIDKLWDYLNKFYDWLVTRDWAKSLKGLKNLPAEIGAQFFEQTKDGIKLGPITQIIINAFKIAVDYIQEMFERLWAKFGADAMAAVQGMFSRMASAARRAAEDILAKSYNEELAKKWKRLGDDAFARATERKLGLGNKALETPWANLSEQQRAAFGSALAAKGGYAVQAAPTLAAEAEAAALRKSADMLAGLAGAAGKGGDSAEALAAELDTVTQSHQKYRTEVLDEMPGLIKQITTDIGAAVGRAFPAAAPATGAAAPATGATAAAGFFARGAAIGIDQIIADAAARAAKLERFAGNAPEYAGKFLGQANEWKLFADQARNALQQITQEVQAGTKPLSALGVLQMRAEAERGRLKEQVDVSMHFELDQGKLLKVISTEIKRQGARRTGVSVA